MRDQNQLKRKLVLVERDGMGQRQSPYTRHRFEVVSKYVVDQETQLVEYAKNTSGTKGEEHAMPGSLYYTIEWAPPTFEVSPVIATVRNKTSELRIAIADAPSVISGVLDPDTSTLWEGSRAPTQVHDSIRTQLGPQDLATEVQVDYFLVTGPLDKEKPSAVRLGNFFDPQAFPSVTSPMEIKNKWAGSLRTVFQGYLDKRRGRPVMSAVFYSSDDVETAVAAASAFLYLLNGGDADAVCQRVCRAKAIADLRLGDTVDVHGHRLPALGHATRMLSAAGVHLLAI